MDDYYYEESWDRYDEMLEGHETGEDLTDSRCYIPTPEEIKQRKKDLVWLQSHEFSNYFICCVMQQETPSIELVKRLVDKYGPEETYRRLKPFLPRNEYRRTSYDNLFE